MLFLIGFSVVLLSLVNGYQISPLQRAHAMLDRMNTSQKLRLVYGIQTGYAGTITGIPELGIPSCKMEDGPQGARTCL